jgi:hypothetical protein
MIITVEIETGIDDLAASIDLVNEIIESGVDMLNDKDIKQNIDWIF